MQINCHNISCSLLSYLVLDASQTNLLMSAPSSLNVLINPQALNQAAASQQCGNVIYMIRGAKSENGSQIVIQNTQELLNLLNKNHSKFAVTESIVDRSETHEIKAETKASDNVNNHLNLQHLSKDSRLVIKSLDKSHSFLVVRNGSRNAPSLIESRTEKDETKTSQANEHVKESNESSEVQKHIPIGTGESKSKFPIRLHLARSHESHSCVVKTNFTFTAFI